LSSLDHEPLMRALREQTMAVSNSELERSLRRIQAGDNPEMVLQQLAHALSQKFLHRPTTELNDTSDESMLIAARKLFGIDALSEDLGDEKLQVVDSTQSTPEPTEGLDNSDKKH